MKYPLKNINSIDNIVLAKLKSVNIRNTYDLFKVTNTETKRKSLAHKLEISLKDIEFLASLSDIVRIKGVGIKTAIKLINTCNFKNIQGITNVNKLNIYTNDHIDNKLLKEKFNNCSFSKYQFTEVSKAAAELKPRLVFEKKVESIELNKTFISEIKKQKSISGKWGIKFIFFAFTLVFLTSLSILTILFYPIYSKYKILNDLFQRSFDVKPFMPAFWLKIFNLVGDTIIIITIIVLFLILWQIVEKWFGVFIYKILFRRDIFKRIFLKIDYTNLIKKVKKSSNQLILIALLFAISVIIIFFLKGFEGMNYLLIPVILLLLFLIIILYYNTYLFYYKIKKLQKSAQEVYQRILFSSQVEMLFSLLVLIIGLNIVIPFALESVKLFEKEVIIETSYKEYHEALQLINFKKLTPDFSKNIKEILKNMFIFKPAFDFGEGKIENMRMIFHETPGLITSIFGTLLLGLILSFSIPYFKFLGVRAGVTFLIVIGISMTVNFIVEKKFGIWFFIEGNQIMRQLFIFIFSYWFAILFDWFYKTLTFNKRECPNCNNLIEKGFNFCPHCGFIND